MYLASISNFESTVAITLRVLFGVSTPSLIYILLGMIFLDIVSGLFASAFMGKMRSSVMYKSLLKKLSYFVLMSAVNLFTLANPAMGTGLVIALISYLILVELLSLLENLSIMGVVPDWLTDKLNIVGKLHKMDNDSKK